MDSIALSNDILLLGVSHKRGKEKKQEKTNEESQNSVKDSFNALERKLEVSILSTYPGRRWYVDRVFGRV